jgi:hypothetical protein
LAVGHSNKKNLMGPILFLYYEESLVSSNLNSKLFQFHSAHPKFYNPTTAMGFSAMFTFQLYNTKR